MIFLLLLVAAAVYLLGCAVAGVISGVVGALRVRRAWKRGTLDGPIQDCPICFAPHGTPCDSGLHS